MMRNDMMYIKIGSNYQYICINIINLKYKVVCQVVGRLYRKVPYTTFNCTGPLSHYILDDTVLLTNLATPSQATWGKRCNKLLLVSTKPDPTIPEVVSIDVPEGLRVCVCVGVWVCVWVCV